MLKHAEEDMRRFMQLLALVTGIVVASVAAHAGGKVEIPIDDDGFFVVQADIAGVAVQFKVDTGANDIVIGGKLAEEIIANLPKQVGETTKRAIADTANGQVEIVYVKMQSIKIGEIELKNVPVALAPTVPANLLGTDFLKEISFSYSKGKLTLEQ